MREGSELNIIYLTMELHMLSPHVITTKLENDTIILLLWLLFYNYGRLIVLVDLKVHTFSLLPEDLVSSGRNPAMASKQALPNVTLFKFSLLKN